MNIRYDVLGQATVDDAFDLATEVFVSASTLHRALGIGLQDYRAYLRPSFDAMVSENLSVVALADGNVVGCLIATDFTGNVASAINPPAPFDAIASITRQLCSEYSDGREIPKGEAVMVDMAAVSPAHTGHGIYQNIRHKAQEVARVNGFNRIVTELSSAATQHVVLNRLHHTKLAEILFKDFEHQGHFPFAKISEPTSIILAEGYL